MCKKSCATIPSINAYTKFGEILSICSQGIEQKLYSDTQNDRWNDGKHSFFSKLGYHKVNVKLLPVKSPQT